jgi:hypothetical protein
MSASVTGLVAAHPDHANAIIVFLDAPASPKFRAGERVTVTAVASPTSTQVVADFLAARDNPTLRSTFTRGGH